jgi:hypothetical protein
MRLEATVPESRGQAVDQLATELGLSRSQVIDEALAVFFQAISAVRRGQRLVAVDPAAKALDCLIVTPTLAALEWASKPEPLQVSPEALEKVRALLAAPPAPSSNLRAAAERFKTSRRRDGKR